VQAWWTFPKSTRQSEKHLKTLESMKRACVLFSLLLASLDSALASEPATVPEAGPEALSCLTPSNCVNSFDSLGLDPLRFDGTAAQAMEILKATLATFPEAVIFVDKPPYLETEFSTRIGFKDQVEFIINESARRIDFRSRSKFGLYDFGKNRSRMREFSAAFEKQQGVMKQ